MKPNFFRRFAARLRAHRTERRQLQQTIRGLESAAREANRRADETLARLHRLVDVEARREYGPADVVQFVARVHFKLLSDAKRDGALDEITRQMVAQIRETLMKGSRF